MNPVDPILFRQLPAIHKIIQDETWLEAERRGCHVRSDDRIVREKVCEIILRIGQQLRDRLTRTAQSGCDLTASMATSVQTVQSRNEAA